MRAVRWHGRGDVRVEEVPDAPAPGPREVELAVDWCGICGTDVEEFRNGPLVIATDPHPLTGYSAPIVIGHEVAGRVVSVGSAVENFAVGDSVAVDGILPCGACPACDRHDVQLCDRVGAVGMSWPGGLAERLTVPDFTVVAARSAPTDALAMAEPLSVAVRALRRGRVRSGERIMVIGAGAIGLAALLVARAQGCGDVVVVDPVPARRALALQLGAAAALDPSDDLAAVAVSARGDGPDAVIECSGQPGTVRTATKIVRKGGRVVLVGLHLESEPFRWLGVVAREIDIIGSVSHVYDEDFVDAVRLIDERAVDPLPLVTHRIPLERAVSDGLAPLAAGALTGAIKILVSPSGGAGG